MFHSMVFIHITFSRLLNIKIIPIADLEIKVIINVKISFHIFNGKVHFFFYMLLGTGRGLSRYLTFLPSPAMK